jgi:hypothetical protein
VRTASTQHTHRAGTKGCRGSSCPAAAYAGRKLHPPLTEEGLLPTCPPLLYALALLASRLPMNPSDVWGARFLCWPLSAPPWRCRCRVAALPMDAPDHSDIDPTNVQAAFDKHFSRRGGSREEL